MEMRLRKKIGEEILIAEVDDHYRYSSSLHLLEHCRMMAKVEIIGIRKPRGSLADRKKPLMLICKNVRMIKWTALAYEIKEGAYLTVFPLLGKVIIWKGGMINLEYGAGRPIIAHDEEIGIMRADGLPRKDQKNEDNNA